jgi:organic hydroperoxide reductase OsmC/OhrA
VDAAGPTPEELAQLIEAADRECYVSSTLRAAVEVTVSTRSAG